MTNNETQKQMNEFLFEYYYDPKRKKCCLNCKYYFKYMEQFNAQRITKVDDVKTPHKYGQKYCIKHKVFVWFIDACGSYVEW